MNFIWMKINTVNATSHILLWIFCSSNSLTNDLGRKAAPKMFWHFSYLTLLTLKNEIFIFIVSIQICLDATLPNWCLCIHALLIKSYETSFFSSFFFFLLNTSEFETQWEGALLWQAWPFHQKEPQCPSGGERMALQTGAALKSDLQSLIWTEWCSDVRLDLN